MTKTTNNSRTEYSAKTTDKGAILDHQNHMVFGRWEQSAHGRVFVCAHCKPSRTYKTIKGADRAAAKWMAA